MELTEVIYPWLNWGCWDIDLWWKGKFAADNLAKTEANLEAIFYALYIFLKETEKRKELMRRKASTRDAAFLDSKYSEEVEEDKKEEEYSKDEEE